MKTTKIITAILVAFTGAIAVLIAYNLIQGRQDAAGAAGAPAGGPGFGGPPGGGGPSRNTVVVQVTEAVLGTIENTVVVSGDVLTRNQVSIFPTVGGRLAEMRIGIGDTVRAGSVVAMVDPSRPGEVFSLSPVLSTFSGTVLQAPFSVGDTVSANSALFVVGDLSSLRIETFVPERFVSSIRSGMMATVNLEAIPTETFYASIDEVSPVLDPASRTLRIRLAFVNGNGVRFQDPRIRAGMFATVGLVVDSRQGVTIIPRVAAINTQGRWVAFVADGNVARRRELELGMESELLFEVRSGIEIGELVVSAGQNFLAEGDLLRIVE